MSPWHFSIMWRVGCDVWAGCKHYVGSPLVSVVDVPLLNVCQVISNQHAYSVMAVASHESYHSTLTSRHSHLIAKTLWWILIRHQSDTFSCGINVKSISIRVSLLSVSWILHVVGVVDGCLLPVQLVVTSYHVTHGEDRMFILQGEHLAAGLHSLVTTEWPDFLSYFQNKDCFCIFSDFQSLQTVAW